MRSIIPALAIAVALVVPAALPNRTAAAEPDFPDSMSGYHNWTELVDEIMQAQADHPDIVSVSSIGTSVEGRDIWTAKVSANVATDEAEPEVLIDALHHAREHLGTEQALAILRWLTDDYGADETVTRLVDTREIFIIFAVNPDGLGYDLTGSPFRAWRKNRQPNAGSTAVGTDLNRNYGYRWGCCAGSSGNPKSIFYRGPAAFSAPETRACPGLREPPRDRWRPADPDACHAPHERPAHPVAVRLHEDQRTGGHHRARSQRPRVPG